MVIDSCFLLPMSYILLLTSYLVSLLDTQMVILRVIQLVSIMFTFWLSNW